MTLDCKVDVIQSLFIHLLFDDHSVKDNLVAVDDLIDVVWNGNGARKHMIGRVAAISAVGSDPNSWYMIVDGADDFKSMRERFSPISILDLEILRRSCDEELIRTEKGEHSCPFIRVLKGRMQYSRDGINWKYIQIDDRDIIEDQEGTVPIMHGRPPVNDEGIEDAVW